MLRGELERREYRNFAERLSAWLRDEIERLVSEYEGASGGIQSMTEYKTLSQVRSFLSEDPFGTPSPYTHHVEISGYVSLPSARVDAESSGQPSAGETGR